MWVRSLGPEDPLEEGIATHSSILARRIPWTEDPRRQQTMGLQRVGHNWSGLAQHSTPEFLKQCLSQSWCSKFMITQFLSVISSLSLSTDGTFWHCLRLFLVIYPSYQTYQQIHLTHFKVSLAIPFFLLSSSTNTKLTALQPYCKPPPSASPSPKQFQILPFNKLRYWKQNKSKTSILQLFNNLPWGPMVWDFRFQLSCQASLMVPHLSLKT